MFLRQKDSKRSQKKHQNKHHLAHQSHTTHIAMSTYYYDHDDHDFDDEERDKARQLFEPDEPDNSPQTNTPPNNKNPLSQHDTQPKKGHPRKISEKTKATYLAYFKAIRKKLIASNPLEFERRDVSPTDLVDYLLGIIHTLRPRTFISYRAALIYWLNQQPQTAEVHHAILALNVALPRYGFKGLREGQQATLYSTRSQRKRTFRKKDFQKLIAELNARATSSTRKVAVSAANLMFWLQAGLATGLRPIEWEKAYWHDKSKGVLFVHTAKSKSDASPLESARDAYNPNPRTRLVKVDPESIFWVEQHLERVKNHLRAGLPFKSYYDNCRVYLWGLNKEIFKHNAFTLYMMRGQFAANKKGAGLLSSEVAELMGCSPYVVQTHYGKKINAHRTTQYPEKSSYKKDMSLEDVNDSEESNHD